MNKFYFTLDIIKSEQKEGSFFVEGYAATTDLDRQNDIIAIEALEEAAPKLEELGKTVFFNHDYDRPVGRLDSAIADNKGLKVRIFVSEWEQELRKKISEGIISKFSIGGIVKSGYKLSPSEALRTLPQLKEKPAAPITVISKMELFEVSIVGLPANAKAEFVQKSLYQALRDTEFEKEVKDLGQIPDNTNTETLPKPIAKEVELSKVEGDVMEEIKKEEPIVTPTVEVLIEKATEVVATPEVKEEKKEVVPAPKDAPKVAEKSEPTPELKVVEAPVEKSVEIKDYVTIARVEVSDINEKGSLEVKVEEKVDEKREIKREDGSVSVSENHTVSVRTYSEEEVTAIKASYDKQLADKDAMIKSLEAKAMEAPAVVAPVQKDVSLVEPKAEKSTPMVALDTVNKEKQTNPTDAFLGIMKGLKTRRS